MTPEKTSASPWFSKPGSSPQFSLSLPPERPGLSLTWCHLSGVQTSLVVKCTVHYQQQTLHNTTAAEANMEFQFAGLVWTVQCLSEGAAAHGSLMADGWRKVPCGMKSLPSMSDKVCRSSVSSRKLCSPPPRLLSCGAVSPSTSPAADGFSAQP